MIRRPPRRGLFPLGPRRPPVLAALLTTGILASVCVLDLGQPTDAQGRGADRAAGPGPSAVPPSPLRRTFRAAGGPVTATVTVTGAPGCRVALVGADGAVLASADVTGGPVILTARAVAAAPITVVLQPRRPSLLGWQVDLAGATG